MKPDSDLKADVVAELRWNPAVDEAHIGVAVRDGIVIVSGQVDSHAQKDAVERAILRVAGVRGLAMDLEVRIATRSKRSDADIAAAALNALHWHSLVPHEEVRVEVDEGVVTLSGEVDWEYQRASAEQCVRPLVGVAAVNNRVTVKPRASAANIAGEITAALRRHADREAKHIQVQVDGAVVTLTGRVDSLPEHEAAIGTALMTRGVSRVIDKLQVAG